MKLSSMQIQNALEYSPHKNVVGLMRALNTHAGLKLTEDEVRDFVVNGIVGRMADNIAYEIGLPSSTGYKKYPKTKAEIHIEEIRKPQSSMHPGVCWHKVNQKWWARISVNKKQKCLGFYAKENDAAEAVQAAREEITKNQRRGLVSGYTGVSWNVRAQKWESRIGVNKKRIRIGYFANENEAALAYNEAAKVLGRKLNEVSV